MGRIDTRLSKVLQLVRPGSNVPIIVETFRPPSSSDVQELSSEMSVKRVSNIANQVYGTADEESIRNIASFGFVSVVFYDEPISRFQFLAPSISISKEDIHIPISDSSQFIGATDLHDEDVTGKGIKVAVIDTGVNKYHPLLQDAVIKQINIAGNNGAEFADINDGNGHGCCHPDTIIYTNNGLERIEDIYNNTKSKEIDGIKEKNDLYALSFKENDNKVCKVSHVHKVKIKEDLVKINDLTLTPWHKCYIFDTKEWCIVEKRSDELKVGDFLISPSKFIEISSNCLDSDISYLMGVIAGDGHVFKSEYRIDISLDSIEVLNRCLDICHDNDIKVSEIEYTKSRSTPRIRIYGWFVKFIVDNKLKTSSVDVTIPDIILNSSEESIKSFISGIVDSDGSTRSESHKGRIRIRSISKGFIYKLYNVISLFGGKPYIIEENKSPDHILNSHLVHSNYKTYLLNFHCSCFRDINDYMYNIDKTDKLKLYYNKNDSIPIKENELRKYLYDNFLIKFDQRHRSTENNLVRLSSVSDWYMSRNKLISCLEHLHLTFLELYNICKNFKFIEIKYISKQKYDGYFYDLTVDDSNNYLAGVTDMVFIHNTHVATTIGGRDRTVFSKLLEKTIRIHGVAPECEIIGIKVLDDEGSGQTSWVIEGMEAAVEAGADVINMSLGSMWDGGGMTPDSKVVDEIVYNHNILCAIAAGNSFANLAIGSPGGSHGAITVGSNAMITPSAGIVSTFSSKGTTTDGRVKPDISAPGGNMLNIKETIYAGTSGMMAEEAGDDYIGIMGTSMATPHVAGCLALLLQSGMKRDRYIAEDLIGNTAKFNHPKDIYTGWGMINVKKAYDYLVGNKNIAPISVVSRVIDIPLKPLASLIPQSEQTIESRRIQLPYLR